MRFYDTGGIEVRNRTLPSHYHSSADAYILVYSVTDKLSFQLLPDIKKDIEKNRDKKDVSEFEIVDGCFNRIMSYTEGWIKYLYNMKFFINQVFENKVKVLAYNTLVVSYINQF